MAKESLTLDQLDFTIGFLGQAIDFTPALKSVRQLVVSATKENFDAEHDPDGKAWLPLKRPRSRKGKPKGTDKILSDTGFLRASITAFGAEGNVEELTPTRMEWGTEVWYASTHQYGRGNVPQRSFLGINESMTENIETIVGDFAEKKLVERLGG